MRRLLTTALLAAVTLGTTALVAPAGAEDAATTTADGRLVLLLDSSGSMKEQSAGGTSKIEAAKAALEDVVDRLPDDAQVGVRVFGATVENRTDEGACTDTQNVVPVGPLDKKAVVAAVGDYQPYGETPIGNALKGAAKDLGSDGKRTIVLLSDGQPTCDPDPCKVAKDLRAQGVDLTVNVVGLNVSGRARSALQCIADAGGGTYYGVDQPEELASSLVTVSVRSLREFQLTGKPVTGGTSTADPTALEPGRWTDTSEGKGTNRYYTVEKPKGGSVAVSAVTRPEYDNLSYDTLEVELLTPDGTRCNRDSYLRQNVLRSRDILSAGAFFSPHQYGNHDECDAAPRLLARVATNAEAPEPFELLVRALPAITNYGTLPAGTDNTEVRALAAEPFPEVGGPVRPVVGGTSFADATELAPGRHRDSIRPGEQLLYRVPAAFGQRVRARVTLESDPIAADQLSIPGIAVETSMYTPTLHNMGRTGANGGALYDGEKPTTLTVEPPAVRVRNVEEVDQTLHTLSIGGDQYLAVAMAGALGNDGSRFAAPITISLVVDGEEVGVPKLAGDPKAKDAAGADDRSTDGSGFPWLPVAAGLLVVVLAAGVLLVVRRRRSAP